MDINKRKNNKRKRCKRCKSRKKTKNSSATENTEKRKTTKNIKIANHEVIEEHEEKIIEKNWEPRINTNGH